MAEKTVRVYDNGGDLVAVVKGDGLQVDISTTETLVVMKEHEILLARSAGSWMEVEIDDCNTVNEEI